MSAEPPRAALDQRLRVRCSAAHRAKLDRILAARGIPTASEWLRRTIDAQYARLPGTDTEDSNDG